MPGTERREIDGRVAVRDDRSVSRWVCPNCEREFGRARQSHVCVPGCTVDECFHGRPAVHRAIYDAIVAELSRLGPVHEDAVRVGVFLKRDRKFAEVRPMVRAVSLLLLLPRSSRSAPAGKRWEVSAGRVILRITLVGVEDVTAQLRGLLAEAYRAAAD
jgi:Domain of unknown function (DUF5655)